MQSCIRHGIPQDDAACTGFGLADVAQTNFTGAAANFSWSFPPYSASVFACRTDRRRRRRNDSIAPPPSFCSLFFGVDQQARLRHTVGEVRPEIAGIIPLRETDEKTNLEDWRRKP